MGPWPIGPKWSNNYKSNFIQPNRDEKSATGMNHPSFGFHPGLGTAMFLLQQRQPRPIPQATQSSRAGSANGKKSVMPFGVEPVARYIGPRYYMAYYGMCVFTKKNTK